MEDKQEYIIVNIGCDDETHTKISLTNKELKLLTKFAIMNNETGAGCRPTISIYDFADVKEEDKDYGVYRCTFKTDAEPIIEKEYK